MHYRTLAHPEFDVPVIGMGCWAISHPELWGVQDERDAIGAIHASLDAGANLIDTAEGYGHGRSEELVGKALAGRRNQAIICTKASPEHHGHDDLVSACEGSLRRLRTEWIDLYMLHWPNHDIPFEETARALQVLCDSGKVRHLAVANFAMQDLADILECCCIVADQLPYNLLWRAIEYELVARCIDANVGIVCYSPLAQGLLTGHYRTPDEVPEGQARTAHFSGSRSMTPHDGPGAESQTFSTIDAIRDVARAAGIPMANLALAWLLAQPGVTSVVAGARTAQEAIDNCAASQVVLSDDVLVALNETTDNLKQHFGSSNPDMWLLTGRMR